MFEFGFGGGDSKGWILYSWKKMFDMMFGFHPSNRSLALPPWAVVETKWTGMLWAEIRRVKWRSWLRWPCNGSGTITTTTAFLSLVVTMVYRGVWMRVWIYFW